MQTNVGGCPLVIGVGLLLVGALALGLLNLFG